MLLNKIYNYDCLDGLNRLKESNTQVDLVVTSPPYNLSIEYEEYVDKLSYKDYLNWVKQWIQGCYEVLVDGGKICINIPLEISKIQDKEKNKYSLENSTKEMIMKDYMNILEEVGFIYVTQVIWNKTVLTTRTAWGTYRSPSCPNIMQPMEAILVFSKGSRKKEGNKELIDITSDEFIEYTLGVWEMNPESAKRIGHPAPFPKELPYRCIKMFTYRGDTVLDIFSGSGTTAVVAKEEGRNYLGFDITESYIELSESRLSEAEVKDFDYEQYLIDEEEKKQIRRENKGKKKKYNDTTKTSERKRKEKEVNS